jgi:predicted RNase H-like nuclease (RuvC/YqgF family)
MEGIAELRAKLAVKEKRDEETNEELRQRREQICSQRDQIRELEATIAKLHAEISKLKEQLASQKGRHDEEMKELKEKVAALEANEARQVASATINAAAKERDIRQQQRYTFVAGQLANIFIERLSIMFLKREWKKHRRFVSNLDELRTVMKNTQRDTAPLDKYLEDNCNGLDEGDICDVLHDAKERRNPGAHPVCLEPDHVMGDCECDPSPADVKKAIEKVTRRDRFARTVLLRALTMTEHLGRDLHHRRLLQLF